MNPTKKQVSEAASILGRIGGKSGTGAAKARDYERCKKAALARWGGIALQQRFEQKFKKGNPEECWPWLAGKNSRGYGRFGIAKNFVAIASRVAFELYVRLLKPNEFVLHRCDNPCCVNPDHLFPGSKGDNRRDCVAKGRSNTPKGSKAAQSKLTEQQVLEIRAQYSPAKPPHSLPKGELMPGSYGWLAKKYGVTRGAIQQVVQRTRWKHI